MVLGSAIGGSYHMSICVEYSEDPSRTSGGRYQRVTTSLEYVLVGTDLARARPAGKTGHMNTHEDFTHSIKKGSDAEVHPPSPARLIIQPGFLSCQGETWDPR